VAAITTVDHHDISLDKASRKEFAMTGTGGRRDQSGVVELPSEHPFGGFADCTRVKTVAMGHSVGGAR
jgi:ribosomal protein L2